MTSPFGAQSTTDDVLAEADLEGKRFLVTGVSAGLGVETARALMERGAHVVGTARDLAKARKAMDAAAPKRGSLDLVAIDLASLASVRACADALLAARAPFDVIIANAGVMACPKGTTSDGFETQFGTNHLGHFVLVNRLAPLLGPGARVVILSSAAHRFSDVDLDDPGFERTEYQPFVAYGRSKTANALFAVALDRRLRPRGVRAASVHPGVIPTELGRHLTPDLVAQVIRPGGEPPARKTIPQGAATSVWCAVAAPAAEIGGRYCEDCHVAEPVSDPKARRGVRAYALDEARAEALWTKSEQMVGERFDYA